MSEYKYKYEFEYKYKAEYEQDIKVKPNPEKKSIKQKPKSQPSINPESMIDVFNNKSKKSKYVNEQGLFEFNDGYETPAVYVPILSAMQLDKNRNDEKIMFPDKEGDYKKLLEETEKYWEKPENKKRLEMNKKTLKHEFDKGNELINKITGQMKKGKTLNTVSSCAIHEIGNLTGEKFVKKGKGLSDPDSMHNPLSTHYIRPEDLNKKSK